MLLLDSVTRPDYGPLHHFGSKLANDERGRLMSANIVTAGTLTICFAIGLRRVLEPGRGAHAAPVFVGSFGLGRVVAGVFVADPNPGYPAGSTGTANLFPTWTLMTVAMLVLASRFAADKQWVWAWYSIASAVATETTLLVAVSLYDADTQTGSYHGLWQRISITLGFGYFSVLAIGLVRRHSDRY